MDAPSPRVATLLPSATELVCALGLAEHVVGVSHECDWPPKVRGRRVLTAPRVALPRDSRGIDRGIRAVLADALAVYEVDVEALREVRPDVVVTQDLCDVCAVSLSDVQAAARELAGLDLRIVSLKPTRLGDIEADLLRLGGVLARPAEAREACAAFRARIDAVRARSAALAERPRVLTLEWLDPVMVGGTWMPELVALAGGTPLVTRPGEHAPTLDRAALAALDPAPDVVLVKPCGFDLERTAEERDVLADLLAAVDWPAVAEGRVWVADGNAYFNRPGPRLADSLEILAACVHPDTFGDLAERHAASFHRFA